MLLGQNLVPPLCDTFCNMCVVLFVHLPICVLCLCFWLASMLSGFVESVCIVHAHLSFCLAGLSAPVYDLRKAVLPYLCLVILCIYSICLRLPIHLETLTECPCTKLAQS